MKWFKSSFSGPVEQHCVETCFRENEIAVRDSKDPDGDTLCFTVSEWDAFIKGVKAGEFDT